VIWEWGALIGLIRWRIAAAGAGTRSALAKLDWSRVAIRILDPARYQRSADTFFTPDKPTTPRKKKLSPEARKRQLEHDRRMAEQQAAKRAKKAAARAAQREIGRLAKTTQPGKRAKARKKKLAAKQIKAMRPPAREAVAEAGRIAFEEYQKTPEYAAKVERDRAKLATKLKTHLQAWAEKQDGLREDRDRLRKRWRERLLGQRTEP
jgi:hypothetical protein